MAATREEKNNEDCWWGARLGTVFRIAMKSRFPPVLSPVEIYPMVAGEAVGKSENDNETRCPAQEEGRN